MLGPDWDRLARYMWASFYLYYRHSRVDLYGKVTAKSLRPQANYERCLQTSSDVSRRLPFLQLLQTSPDV